MASMVLTDKQEELSEKPRLLESTHQESGSQFGPGILLYSKHLKWFLYKQLPFV